MKGYNLEGFEHSGKTLVGNWYEERQWQDNYSSIKRSCHDDITGQFDDSVYETETRSQYGIKQQRHAKVPPRQRMAQRQAAQEITRELRTEELAAEDHEIQFTRGRYLHEPQPHPDLKLDYLTEAPITLYSETRQSFGRDSHFTQPIEDYNGHEKVKIA